MSIARKLRAIIGLILGLTFGLVNVAKLEGAPAAGSGVAMDAVPLGPLMGSGGHYQPMPVISADATHALVIAPKGSRVQAYVDGNPGPVASQITIFGQGTNNLAAFSADGKRVAYIVHLNGGKQAVVVDSTQSPLYTNVPWLGFAPVGDHYAYAVQQGSGYFIVDNGKAGRIYNLISAGPSMGSSNPVFSPEGQHLAYIAIVNSSKGPVYRVVLDGVEQPHFPGIQKLIFSKDGKHLGYIAGVRGLASARAVIDGKAGATYAAVTGLVFSDDGSRSAYIATKGKTNNPSFVVVDNGTEGPEFGLITELAVSPDGQRLAYVGTNYSATPAEVSVMDNGKAGQNYIACRGVKFSLDGKMLTYVATASLGQFLVVNGEESGPFLDIGAVAFSEDKQHWACTARASENSDVVVLDGKSMPVPAGVRAVSVAFEAGSGKLFMTGSSAYNGAPVMVDVGAAAGDAKPGAGGPGQIIFSSNHQHCVKVSTTNFGQSNVTQQIAIDDQPVQAGKYSAMSKLAISDDGQHVAYIGTATGENGQSLIHAVYDGHDGAGHFSISDLAMSPDGGHIAYVAEDGGKWYVMIDGMKGPAFGDVLITSSYLAGARQLSFMPDGSLQFFATFDGQLHRCTYSAAAISAAPSLAQVNSVTAGSRKLTPDGLGDIRGIALTADGMIYGVSRTGGTEHLGSLFRCKLDGSDYSVIHSFTGGENGTLPGSVFAAPDGNIYGAAAGGSGGSKPIVFRYDTKANEFGVVKADRDCQGLYGVTPDGTLIGNGGLGGSLPMTLWSMKLDGSDWKTGQLKTRTDAMFMGPDGALFGVATDSLIKVSAIDAEPVVLHQFSEVRADGESMGRDLAFGKGGMIYGFMNKPSVDVGTIYSINADGSGYTVVCKPSSSMRLGSLAVGEDGVVWGYASGDGFGRDAGLCTVPTDGSAVKIVAPCSDQRMQATWIVRGGAMYGFSLDSVFAFQPPAAGAAGNVVPTVAVNAVSPAPYSTEAITITGPGGVASN